ncbi:MAG: site-specific DNA-methyltransferase, partial [Cytophagales bacterium]|nr:site-specific DNA-methyltransferase [Cytophagales bacterium]
MIKDTVQNNDKIQSNVKQIEALRENFPACFKADGTFDIERFKTEIADKTNLTQEGYELKFLGKSYAKLLASTDTTTVIQPDEAHNSLPENVNSENIYISGDNLDGLKHLLKSYNKSIKCIYIDPPYNTGSDGFVYQDNFNYTKENLQDKLSISEDEAERILDLTKRGSASHSAWLTFMYSRLLLSRDLLTDDGVIFISIDDNEQANLKMLCDDVFGEENLISQIIIQSNKRGQTYKQLAKTHEYLLVYVRSENSLINELKKEISNSTKTDNIGDYSERELRNRNPKYGRFNRPNL